MSNRKANKLWIWADLKFSVTLLQMCGAWNLNAASQCLVLTDSKGTLSQTTWEVLDGSLRSSRSDMYINPRPFSALETKNSIWTSILWQTGSQCHYLRTGAAAVFWISCSCLIHLCLGFLYFLSLFSVSPLYFLCMFGSVVRSSVFAPCGPPLYSARVPHVIPVVLGLVLCNWIFLSLSFVSCLLFTGLSFVLSKLVFCFHNLLCLVLHPGPLELNLTKTFCAANFEWIAGGWRKLLFKSTLLYWLE